MDPVSVIMAALVLGAAAGLKPTAEMAVKDTYKGLRALVKCKYSDVDIEVLEKDPASESRQNVVREEIEKSGADSDAELLDLAQALIDAVEQYEPDMAQSVGVKLSKIKAANLNVEDVSSSGTGVDVEDAVIDGDIVIKKIQAGNGGGEDQNAGKKV